jgi:hypothetical protein
MDTDVHQIPDMGSLFTCPSAGSAQQPLDRQYEWHLGLRMRLPPDGAFLAAAVGAAEATAGGQAGSARSNK